MDAYRARALEGASGVELTIALYDGIVRLMQQAIDAVEQNDADARRAAVKRAMDIVMHLQVSLDGRAGGKPAEALSEFYIAMFALMLQGSQANCRAKFEQVIANVRNVRGAWKQVLEETTKENTDAALARGMTYANRNDVAECPDMEPDAAQVSWTA